MLSGLISTLYFLIEAQIMCVSESSFFLFFSKPLLKEEQIKTLNLYLFMLLRPYKNTSNKKKSALGPNNFYFVRNVFRI